MQSVQAVVLAAGKSTRFIGPTTKLLANLCGTPLLLHSLKLLEKLNLPTIYVLGHQKEVLQTLLQQHAGAPINFAFQEEQLGTGHAVQCSQGLWTADNILVLNGDMPLLTPSLLQQFIASHQQTHAAVSLMVFRAQNPHGYGRVFLAGKKVCIVEHRDCNYDQRTNNLVNAGVYIFSQQFLRVNLPNLSTGNQAKEFYLTDLVGLASAKGLKTNVFHGPEAQLLGINTMEELLQAENVLSAQLNFVQ